jgi:hypothetical protein
MTMSARELKTWPYIMFGDLDIWRRWKAELKFRRKIGIATQFKYY